MNCGLVVKKIYSLQNYFHDKLYFHIMIHPKVKKLSRPKILNKSSW